MTLDEARLLAGVNERSQHLFRDGYYAKRLDEYIVEINTPDGETYEVDTVFETCSCPFYKAWQGRHDCKHLLGYPKLLGDQEQARQRAMRERTYSPHPEEEEALP